MTVQSKIIHEVGFEKASVTVGLALIIWSFFLANITFSSSAHTLGPFDIMIILGLILLPLIGAYLLVNSSVNLLRAIRDGE